jgi:hypothetical protein
MMRKALAAVLFFFYSHTAFSQACCSGGSGSPIAGGTSQGVLNDRQAEIGLNFQHVNSNKFLTGDKPVKNFLDNFNSNYLYGRFAYGVSSKLTMSIETGYFINKTQVGLNRRDTISNSGVGDIILFPRYNVYQHNTENARTEFTVGLGYKIPVGKYLDSSVIYTNPTTGQKLYTPMPPAVMPTTGSNDIIFYGFGYHGYPFKKNLRFFTSILYIKKGWNPLGQKFGDYASVSLFAGRTFFRKLGVTLQLKGETIAKMQHDRNVDMLALYNIDINATGGKAVFVVPQLGYSFKSFSMYVLTEIPVYQYVNGTAIASQYQFTAGLSYRFLTFTERDE